MLNEDEKSSRLMIVALRFYKLITAVLIIAIIALGGYFILLPKYQQMSVGGKYSPDILQEDLAERQEYLRDLKTLTANYKRIKQTEMNKLEQILPAEADFPGLFVQFQSLAEKYNYRLAAININEAPKDAKAGASGTKNKIQKLDISLNLVGSEGSGYPQIKKFLAGLENNLRLFDISAVYFRPDSPDFSVNVFTYYY